MRIDEAKLIYSMLTSSNSQRIHHQFVVHHWPTEWRRCEQHLHQHHLHRQHLDHGQHRRRGRDHPIHGLARSPQLCEGFTRGSVLSDDVLDREWLIGHTCRSLRGEGRVSDLSTVCLTCKCNFVKGRNKTCPDFSWLRFLTQMACCLSVILLFKELLRSLNVHWTSFRGRKDLKLFYLTSPRVFWKEIECPVRHIFVPLPRMLGWTCPNAPFSLYSKPLDPV